MADINITSMLAGAALTISTGIILYFLNNIFLFRSKIIWSKRNWRESYINEWLYINDDRDKEYIRLRQISFLIHAKGWNPAKDIVIHFDGLVDRFKIDPEVPYKTSTFDAATEVRISTLNKGKYVVSARSTDKKVEVLSVLGVESSNASTFCRDEQPRSFEKPIWYNVLVRPAIIGAVFILSVNGILSSLREVTQSATSLPGAKSQTESHTPPDQKSSLMPPEKKELQQ